MSHSVGIIVMFFGLRSEVPNGWNICDGTNGTPDLEASFVRGAADAQDAGNTGGAASHTHDFTGDGHTHDFIGGIGLDIGAGNKDETTSENTTGTTDSGNSLPTFRELLYLQKS